MSILDFFRPADINSEVKRYNETIGAVLLDVRTPEEFKSGHIQGSRNIPLDILDDIIKSVPHTDTPLFVYCRSGSRSSQAVKKLKQMGYSNVKNIGGILKYTGKTVK